MVANVAACRGFPDWWFEIDQQAVGCGQVNGILVVTSRKLVLEVVPEVAETAAVSALEERKSEGAVMRSLARCVAFNEASVELSIPGSSKTSTRDAKCSRSMAMVSSGPWVYA